MNTLKLSEEDDIQAHIIQLEEIFVDVVRVNDPATETEKTGILLRSLPTSL